PGADDDRIIELTTPASIFESGTQGWQLNFYPSPAQTEITINNFPMDGQIEVTDMLGKVVYFAEVNTISQNINVSEWQPGFYTIRYRTQKGVSTGKFIKQ
ncbi:MAG: T9SS type A sorting domain-containing protein, partial [Bacteroidota bacterium]|nr:T9SS type A sorting domain-containing protein [Bacteroidota bacterium]